MNLHPTSQQDEFGVIGCCLLGGLETALEAVELVPADAFATPNLREAFRLIEVMTTAGQEVSPMSMERKWRELNQKPAPNEILASPELVASAANLTYYTGEVMELWRKRKILQSCYSVLLKGESPQFKSDDILSDLEKAIAGDEIAKVQTYDGRACSDRMLNDLERRFQLQGNLSGIGTGFFRYDGLTDGVQFGEQTIIGARPSMGKTALGLCLVMQACYRNRVPTLFVTMEMSVEAIMRRLCSAWCEIPLSEIRKGSYTEGQFKSFTNFRSFSAKSPLFITDAIKGISIGELCAIVRRRIRKNGVKLVIIDYLQKIRAAEKQEKKTYEVGEVSTTIRAMAVSTGAAFVTLAQLNRESERDKGRAPRLADLGDSKQIEQDADTVALIHRKRDDPAGDTKLIIAKQRDGSLGLVDLVFNYDLCRFENPSVYDRTASD